MEGGLTATHLSNFGQIPQIEGVVALVRRGQQLSTDSVVRLHCAGHNGAAQGPQVGGPVCQEAPQDCGQDGFDGSVGWWRDTQLGEVACKAGAKWLPPSPCKTQPRCVIYMF